ncbi:MAG: DUF4037 domain-containing protein [Anaerolineae bacterium]
MGFLPGLELCRRFYWEAVRPILDRRWPNLPHAAALIGDGSEVLGFDDEMSSDHHWGPRVLLFLKDEDRARLGESIHTAFAEQLPYEFLGYSTNFSQPNPEDNGTQLLTSIDRGPVNHRVVVTTVRGFFKAHLGFDIEEPLTPADWLSFSEQKLLTATAGAVYHDVIGLKAERARFAYYPRDVWLYLLAADWTRIGQEEHLMGRAGVAGDEIGSALICGRLIRTAMHLGFLMERVYAPYSKWYGTAFSQLACADIFVPSMRRALTAETWQAREENLVDIYEALARMHNELGLTEPMPERVTSFFGRPFRVMALHGFADALVAQIRDLDVRRIAARPLIGSIEQFSDCVDLVSDVSWRPRLRDLYR